VGHQHRPRADQRHGGDHVERAVRAQPALAARPLAGLGGVGQRRAGGDGGERGAVVGEGDVGVGGGEPGPREGARDLLEQDHVERTAGAGEQRHRGDPAIDRGHRAGDHRALGVPDHDHPRRIEAGLGAHGGDHRAGVGDEGRHGGGAEVAGGAGGAAIVAAQRRHADLGQRAGDRPQEAELHAAGADRIFVAILRPRAGEQHRHRDRPSRRGGHDQPAGERGAVDRQRALALDGRRRQRGLLRRRQDQRRQRVGQLGAHRGGAEAGELHREQAIAAAGDDRAHGAGEIDGAAGDPGQRGGAIGADAHVHAGEADALGRHRQRAGRREVRERVVAEEQLDGAAGGARGGRRQARGGGEDQRRAAERRPRAAVAHVAAAGMARAPRSIGVEHAVEQPQRVARLEADLGGEPVAGGGARDRELLAAGAAAAHGDGQLAGVEELERGGRGDRRRRGRGAGRRAAGHRAARGGGDHSDSGRARHAAETPRRGPRLRAGHSGRGGCRGATTSARSSGVNASSCSTAPSGSRARNRSRGSGVTSIRPTL
jgi:hypothetical protein